jgi:hypothetical protein
MSKLFEPIRIAAIALTPAVTDAEEGADYGFEADKDTGSTIPAQDGRNYVLC